MNQKLYLYRVDLKNNSPLYGSFYVVSTCLTDAYSVVRSYLDDRDICMSDERVLDSVTLIAEEGEYPECKTHLMICTEGGAQDE